MTSETPEEVSASRQFDLEARRTETEFEIRRAELEEKRAQRQSDEKRYERDAELKRLEVTSSTGRRVKFTTAQATVAVALLALVSSAIGLFIQGWSAQRLDRQKFEAGLVQKSIDTPNRQDQIRNLKFYVNAGFISDPGGKIARMEDSELPSSTPTVLGGAASSVSEWPWLVSVYGAGGFICNGTLIAPRMVLSTAHCVTRGQASDYEVATVTDDLQVGRVRASGRISVTKIVAHPTFSADTSKDDIAIIELSVELPPPFATISAKKSADPQRSGTLALVAAVSFVSQPGNLNQGPIAIADDAPCARFGNNSALEGTICAGFEGVRPSVCPRTGSAGGPLVLLTAEGRKYQIGIVSRADDCNKKGVIYSIYTRVSSYADWIRQVVPNVLEEPMKDVKP